MLNIVENESITFHYEGYAQVVYRGGLPFYPSIGENILEIAVDVSWNAKLRFAKERELAENAIKEGKLLLWQLDLGLERALFPLSDEGHFLAQTKALEEFVSQLAQPLAPYAFGSSLYKGPVDFSAMSPSYSFEDKIDLRNSLVDYLKMLAPFLPETMPLFLMMEGGEDPAEFLALTSKDTLFPFYLIAKHPLLTKMPYSFDMIGWGSPTVMGRAYSSLPKVPSKRLSCAFLLPHSSYIQKEIWQEFAAHLNKAEQVEARLIPEVLLTQSWEGVDDLYVMQKHLTLQGKRKLAGFVAAGGKVINLSL